MKKQKLKPVKAWALTYNGRITRICGKYRIYPKRSDAQDWICSDEKIVRVEIREVEK